MPAVMSPESQSPARVGWQSYPVVRSWNSSQSLTFDEQDGLGFGGVADLPVVGGQLLVWLEQVSLACAGELADPRFSRRQQGTCVVGEFANAAPLGVLPGASATGREALSIQIKCDVHDTRAALASRTCARQQGVCHSSPYRP